jgi:hypothetical protein
LSILSEYPSSLSVFSGSSCCWIFNFRCIVLSTIFCLYVQFPLAIVLSFWLPFTFKRFLWSIYRGVYMFVCWIFSMFNLMFHLCCSVKHPDYDIGADPGAHQAHAPLKLEKIWFFGVKSWFFTRNTPKMFAPPSAWRPFFKCAPLTWNPGSALVICSLQWHLMFCLCFITITVVINV